MFDLVYNVDYELAAFFFTILLFIETGICYPKENSKNRLFRVMTCLVIVTEAFDIISAVTLTYGRIFPVAVNYIVFSGYFMSGLVLCYMFHYYIETAVVPANGRKVMSRFNTGLLVISEIAVLINPFFGYFVSFTSEGEYLHGSLYLLLHLLSCWFVLCASAALIINRKILKKTQILSGFLFILLYFIAVLLQTFVCPNVLIIMPAASAILIITIFTLESPDFVQLQKTLHELTDTKQELEKANKKYIELAYTDLMTGLRNRTAYNITLEELEDKDTSKMFFLAADINNLKYLNDNLGHLVGDNAIIKTAKLLSQAFGRRCQCYRIGGDEFVVLSIDMSPEEFMMAYSSFTESVLVAGEKSEYPFSVASGYQEIGELTLLEAQKKADEKMYENKMTGRKEL